MRNLAAEVLAEFVEAQGLVERRVATEEGGLEACRRAYRARHRAAGLCIYCSFNAVDGHPLCFRHLMANRDRAATWYATNRRSANERRRRWRRAKRLQRLKRSASHTESEEGKG